MNAKHIELPLRVEVLLFSTSCWVVNYLNTFYRRIFVFWWRNHIFHTDISFLTIKSFFFFASQVQHCQWGRPRKLLMYVWKRSKDRLCVGRYRSHPFIYRNYILYFPASVCIVISLLSFCWLFRRVWTVSTYKTLIPCCPPAPQIGEVRDKPIVSYVGDSVVIACKMEETKPKPSTWNWYKANGTDKVGELLRGAFCVALKAQFVR